jgi:DNA invertase Pin-like site-specific DNA recombinase
MHGFFAYIRVSTAKQGTKGVSLQEQKEAITRYADRHGFQITQWFEETVTAAKRGRTKFNDMLRRLRQHQARGVIIHKIDRSARNLRDWADLGELQDVGVAIHFASESLDLNSRGGRLSADIQAVVAADFIRNLREETKKGFYGRLKQGYYPMGAPIGYLNQGKAKAKIPDPERALFIKDAFNLYATREYPLDRLVEVLYERGLRTRSGGKVWRTGLSTILNNRFYTGVIVLRKTGESFAGLHEPLVSTALFERVQDILNGRTAIRDNRHNFIFRKTLKCASCNRHLIGERQKGHVYYRCQKLECRGTCVREEKVTGAIESLLATLIFSEDEVALLASLMPTLISGWTKGREERIKGIALQIGKLNDRLKRLTDGYLDCTIDQLLFQDTRLKLLTDRKKLQESLAALETVPEQTTTRMAEILELASSAQQQYISANVDEKRRMVELIVSNLSVSGKIVVVEPRSPFDMIAKRAENSCGDPDRDRTRTFASLVARIWNHFDDRLIKKTEEVIFEEAA